MTWTIPETHTHTPTDKHMLSVCTNPIKAQRRVCLFLQGFDQQISIAVHVIYARFGAFPFNCQATIFRMNKSKRSVVY